MNAISSQSVYVVVSIGDTACNCVYEGMTASTLARASTPAMHLYHKHNGHFRRQFYEYHESCISRSPLDRNVLDHRLHLWRKLSRFGRLRRTRSEEEDCGPVQTSQLEHGCTLSSRLSGTCTSTHPDRRIVDDTFRRLASIGISRSQEQGVMSVLQPHPKPANHGLRRSPLDCSPRA